QIGDLAGEQPPVPLRDGSTIKACLACRRNQLPCQQLQERRLSRAVMPDQTMDAGGFETQVRGLQQRLSVDAITGFFKFEHDGACKRSGDSLHTVPRLAKGSTGSISAACAACPPRRPAGSAPAAAKGWGCHPTAVALPAERRMHVPRA